jgi:hypothetical protein
MRAGRLLLLMAAAMLAPVPVFAQRPGFVVPQSAGEIIERLPAGYRAVSRRGASGASAPVGRLDEAAALLKAAAQSGDARLAARAERLLAGVPDAEARALALKAFALQHRHEFVGALAMLDRLIARDPRDASARLARAEIHLVSGRLDRAREDCTAMALGIDLRAGLLCAASLGMRRGEHVAVTGLLDRLLQDSTASDPYRAFALLLRAESAAQANSADADRYFLAAMHESPADVRIRIARARYLLKHERAQEVEPLLRDDLQSDTAQLLRTFAALDAGRPNAGALVQAQAGRYRLAAALGAEPELRDQAEFELVVQEDASRALALAQRNFRTQRDVEDIDILARAAIAADQPAVLDSISEWARSQRIPFDRNAWGMR